MYTFGPNAEIFNNSPDPLAVRNVIAVWPGMVVFQFANSLFIDNIWVTVGH